MKKSMLTITQLVKKYRVRVLLALTLVMLLFITPALTSAKYKWTLNGSSIIQAKAFYFNSNLLKADGTGYGETTGWDGETCPIDTIEIRNYENTLLANNEGEDLKYTFTWNIQTYDSSGVLQTGNNAYRITEVIKDGVDENMDKTVKESDHTNKITGCMIIGDGTTKADKYVFKLGLPTAWEQGHNPENGSSILISIVAETESSDGSFYQKLQGNFKYIVSTVEGFIKQFDIKPETSGTKDLTLRIGTDVSPSSTAETQTVTIWWNSDCIEANLLNSTFVQMLEAGLWEAKTEVIGEKTYNYNTLKIKDLNSRSYRDLSFYKKNNTLSDVNNSRTEVWFTEETTAALLGKGKDPVTGMKAGAIIGYWFEKSSSSETSETQAATTTTEPSQSQEE